MPTRLKSLRQEIIFGQNLYLRSTNMKRRRNSLVVKPLRYKHKQLDYYYDNIF